MIIKHKKGRHRSKLFILRRVKGLEYIVQFTDQSRYRLPKKDQNDWNKLFGIKKNYFRPRKNSIMGAWRYNPNLDVYETCIYQHDKKGNVFIHNRRILREGEAQNIKIYDIWRGWLLLPWFGGNNKAPKDVEYLIEML